jgi:hypothetical protein
MAYSYIEFPYLPPTRDIAEILAGREEEIERLHMRTDFCNGGKAEGAME